MASGAPVIGGRRMTGAQARVADLPVAAALSANAQIAVFHFQSV
jgi:hypothetical protein